MKAIVVTYKGWTTKPARYIASDSDGNKIQIAYAGSGDPYRFAAEKLCDQMKWKGRLVKGSLGPGKEVFVFDDSN